MFSVFCFLSCDRTASSCITSTFGIRSPMRFQDHLVFPPKHRYCSYNPIKLLHSCLDRLCLNEAVGSAHSSSVSKLSGNEKNQH